MSVSIFVKMSVRLCGRALCQPADVLSFHGNGTCAQQMEFSNAKSIKSFDATGSKYTINSENKKRSVS